MRSRIVYLIRIAVLGALAYFTDFKPTIKSFVGSLFAAFLSAFAGEFFVEMELRPQIGIVEEETPPVLYQMGVGSSA